MKKIIIAAMMIVCGASVVCVLNSCKDKNAAKGQLLEVYDVQGSSAKARLTVDGKVLFVTDVFVGKNGIDKTGEGDAKTPTGTLGRKLLKKSLQYEGVVDFTLGDPDIHRITEFVNLLNRK